MPNYCWNTLVVQGEGEQFHRFRELVKSNTQFIATLVPMPEEVKNTDGAWYGWQLANWGTKWGDNKTEVTRDEDGVVEVRFWSAWTPPLLALDRIAERFPNLEFRLTFEERGLCFRGEALWTDGQRQYDRAEEYEPEPRDDSPVMSVVTVVGDPETLDALLAPVKESLFAAHLPQPPLEDDELCGWRNAHWGLLEPEEAVNVERTAPEEARITFEAHAFPDFGLQSLSCRFPALTFTIDFEDPGDQIRGTYVYRGGNVVEHRIEETEQ